MNTVIDWITQGQLWLAKLQAVGLANASQNLLDQSQPWCKQADALGWPEPKNLALTLADPQQPPTDRATALLDLAVWLSSAQRIAEASQIQPNT